MGRAHLNHGPSARTKLPLAALRHVALTAICAAHLCALPAATLAANNYWLRPSTGGKFSPRSGLSVEVQIDDAIGFGYCPVHVKIAAPAVTNADRQITLRFEFCPTGDTSIVTAVEKSVQLSIGESALTTTLPVPRYYHADLVEWKVWVDGIYDAELSHPRTTLFGPPRHPLRTSAVVVIDADRADETRIIDAWIGRDRASSARRPVVQRKFFSDLPENWLDWSGVDVVMMDAELAIRFFSGDGPTHDALVRWLRLGGHLWVDHCGRSWERLPALSQSIDGRQQDAPPDNPDFSNWRQQSAVDGWPRAVLLAGPVESTERNPLDGAAKQRRVADPADNPTGAIGARGAALNSTEPVELSQTFVSRPVGLGRVLAFRNLPNWRRDRAVTELTRARVRDGTVWSLRHGVAPNLGNGNFAEWLVPGVGLAPVTAFLVLITFFVALIGPANYWFLRKFQRQHLLLLTVPMAAAVTTVALIVYAVLADGLGVVARVRSYTLLDQRSSEATTWARLSYYAGMAPASGLTMPDDLVIYPVLPDAAADLGAPNQIGQRELLWRNGEQKLQQGWLQSRRPTQYLACRARKSPLRLEITQGEPFVAVENRLGVDIRHLIVRDGNGNFYQGAEISAGAATELEPMERLPAMKLIREQLLLNVPELPPGLSPVTYDPRRQRGFRTKRTNGVFYDQNHPPLFLEKGMLHRRLQALQLPPGGKLPLVESSYLAFTEQAPEIDTGIEGCREVGSFHVVEGRW